ncbi:uncharacterized protein LOC113795544 [Dermatophagoides pteronyssinus]|uniref:uncharacterized protein LOC113795544 n=1 Tax=Dermatophagoides pteronyssinus TaxID=6956 RepID=UPI003F6779C5
MTATILPKQLDKVILSSNFGCKSSSNPMKMIIGNDSLMVVNNGVGSEKRSPYLSNNNSITQQQNDGDGSTITEQIKPKRKRQRLDHLTQEQKVMRRKLKNRMAAQSARDRKKKKMMDLEKENNCLAKERMELMKRNRYLEQKLKLYMEENDNLRQKLGIEPIKLEPECDDTMDLYVPYDKSNSHDAFEDEDDDDDDYDDDGSDEDGYQSSTDNYSSTSTANAFESAELINVPLPKVNYRQINRKIKSSTKATFNKESANEDLLATAVDQLFNGFINDNFPQQQQQQQSIMFSDGADNQFGIETIESDQIEQRKLSAGNGSRIEPMFIGTGETMPIEFINETISTQTCSTTDLANVYNHDNDLIVIDHDYAISPMGRKNDDINFKHNQLSPTPPSDSSDIGYESMSSPEPTCIDSNVQQLITQQQQQPLNIFCMDDETDDLLNLDNLNIGQDDNDNVLFPLTTKNDNYPDEIDFIDEDNLQPSINDMITFDSQLHDLFPELF